MTHIRDLVYQNILDSLATLAQQMDELQIAYEMSDNRVSLRHP